MVGEGAGFAVDSVLTREGGDDVSWAIGCSSSVSGGESLRFL